MSNFGQIANRKRVVYADLHFNDADCEAWCLEVSGDRKIFDVWMACATLKEIAGRAIVPFRRLTMLQVVIPISSRKPKWKGRRVSQAKVVP